MFYSQKLACDLILILLLHSHSMSESGVVMMSIDNLPAQLPREATDLFGSKLFPYIPDLVIKIHVE